MEQRANLLLEFKQGVKFIPVVIGPRGQCMKKSWTDLKTLLGISDPDASKREQMGVASFFKNPTAPEKASLAISILKSLAFRVAVNTERNAKKWQVEQREYWNLNEEVGITRLNRG